MILFKNLKKLTNQRGTVKLWLLLFTFLVSGQIALAQTIIKGTITDPNGAPLPGATIIIKGTSKGTISDIEGKYTLTAKENDILVFSSVGYATKEITVTQGASTIDVSMETDLLKLDEVVVIGYGTQRKGDLTAAITSVKSDEFISGSVKDAGQLLQGKIAGLNITTIDGDPAGNSQITLRGQVSINANSDVLVIIDGIPGGDLKTVATQDIADVTVLKDGSSSAIYGVRGNNGVMIITTKRGMKNQPLSVEYSGYVSTETISKKLSILTADDFYRMANDTLPGGSNIYRKIQIEPDGTTSTDWLSEITRTPVSQMHNLTISGGSDKSNYIANFNYNNAQGIFIKSQVENLKARFDINQSMLNDKLTFNLGILSGITNNPSVNPGLAYRNTITRNPTDRVKDEIGNWQERPGFQYYNPVSMLNEEISNSRSRYNWTHGTVTLKPIPGLFLKLLLDRNVWNYNWGDYLTKKHYESVINAQNAIAQLEAQTSIDDLLEYTMEYTKSTNRPPYHKPVPLYS